MIQPSPLSRTGQRKRPDASLTNMEFLHIGKKSAARDTLLYAPEIVWRGARASEDNQRDGPCHAGTPIWPIGIVIAENKLALPRALLDSRQVRLAQRPAAAYGSPEKTLRRGEDLGAAKE